MLLEAKRDAADGKANPPLLVVADQTHRAADNAGARVRGPVADRPHGAAAECQHAIASDPDRFVAVNAAPQALAAGIGGNRKRHRRAASSDQVMLPIESGRRIAVVSPSTTRPNAGAVSCR